MRRSSQDRRSAPVAARHGAVAACAIAVAFGAGAANADPIVQTMSIPSTASDWSSDFTFQQFDPSLGTLDGVGVTLQSTLTGSVAYESREAAASTFSAGFNGSVVTTRPDGTLATSVAPTASTTTNLAAADGKVDFAGPSGGTASLTGHASATTGGTFTPTDAALFTGKGTLAMPVTAQVRATATGPANLVARFQAQISASATLTYDFVAPGQTQSGSFGSVTDIGQSILTTVGILGQKTVTTGPQVVKIANQTTGWTNTAAFQKFNPSLGKLESVNLTMTSNVAGKQGVENLGSTASTISTSQSAALALALGKGTLLSVVTTLSGFQSLAGFDGSIDFGGISGATSNLTGSDTNGASLFDQADLNAFTGTGTIDLDASATGTSSVDGPGNMMIDLAEQAGVTIDVSYTYVPGTKDLSAAADPVPEPGTFALFGASLGFMAFGARQHSRSRRG